MTGKPMTRREALKIAQECISESMRPIAFDANVAINSQGAPPAMQARAERYAKLAAALAYIENMARQKEMHL